MLLDIKFMEPDDTIKLNEESLSWLMLYTTAKDTVTKLEQDKERWRKTIRESINFIELGCNDSAARHLQKLLGEK